MTDLIEIAMRLDSIEVEEMTTAERQIVRLLSDKGYGTMELSVDTCTLCFFAALQS
jgi:hypothetical protein